MALFSHRPFLFLPPAIENYLLIYYLNQLICSRGGPKKIVSYRRQFVSNVEHSLTIKVLKDNLIEKLSLLGAREDILATGACKVSDKVSVYGFADFGHCAVRFSVIRCQSLDRVANFGNGMFQ